MQDDDEGIEERIRLFQKGKPGKRVTLRAHLLKRGERYRKFLNDDNDWPDLRDLVESELALENGGKVQAVNVDTLKTMMARHWPKKTKPLAVPTLPPHAEPPSPSLPTPAPPSPALNTPASGSKGPTPRHIAGPEAEPPRRAPPPTSALQQPRLPQSERHGSGEAVVPTRLR